MPSETAVLDAMRHIIDPDLGQDIVSLGFIKDLHIDNGHVRFTVELTTPACPVKAEFKAQCEAAVMKVNGVESVEVTMGARKPRNRAEGEIPDTLAKVQAIVAVSSCKGGVGKSTVAAHLARAMQRQGLKVGLLDADVYGPSIPTLFGLHNPPVYAAGQILQPVDADGLKLMSMGFLIGENPAVLRGPIVSNYIQQILRQTDWGELDYLLIDMPPGTGDIQLTMVQTISLDGAIIVTTPQALSLVDVARGILMFDKVNVPVLGVVENMCWFETGDPPVRHYPLGRSKASLQKRFGLPTLAELPMTPGISDMAARGGGESVPAFAEMAGRVHRAVGKSRAEGGAAPEMQAAPEGIHVAFPDGYSGAIPQRELRLACPCARCVDEFTGKPILDPESVSAEVHVEGMRRLGNYAVSLAWSDGHTTGIYAWDYLRELIEDRRFGA